MTIEGITPAEQAVLGKLLDGLSNKEIAASLGVSEQCVKNHLRHIYDKCGVTTYRQLVAHFRLCTKD